MDEGRKAVYLRIYSGVLKPGDEVQNARTRKNEKVARLFRVHANRRERIERAGAGSIVVAMGLKDAGTGDTLATPKAPIILERIDTYEPVISRAIEPKTQAEKEKLDFGAGQAGRRGSDLPLRRGRGDRADHHPRHGRAAPRHHRRPAARASTASRRNVGRPQVVYRETLAKPADGEARFERVVEDETLFGHARVHVAPRPRRAGNELQHAAAAAGADAGRAEDPRDAAGDPRRGDGGRARGDALGPAGLPDRGHRGRPSPRIEYRPDASNAAGERAAVGEALRQAWREAGTRLLEPIMKVEITCPEANVGDVLGDLNARRGQIEDVGFRGQQRVITAKVPLRRMFGYSTDLRSATQGRANYSMQFDSYDAWE